LPDHLAKSEVKEENKETDQAAHEDLHHSYWRPSGVNSVRNISKDQCAEDNTDFVKRLDMSSR